MRDWYRDGTMIGKEARERGFQATLYGLESHRQTLPYADLLMT